MPKLAITLLILGLGARGAWYLWMAYRWSRTGQAWGEWSRRDRG
jgi:hypothetical protein